ncbi:MAG: phosphoribosylglycinamide formyltransferase [Desulfobulbus propionicus]|nr:MAG: phosphoribosylglycinamide formyltransferase [Desulfobulbus propionicus]
MWKMAVLLSGSGRTLDNFHRCIQAGTLRASIQVVIADVSSALGLEKARRYGYPAFHAKDIDTTNQVIADHDVDLIALAGYLKLYRPPVGLERNVLNIHPSLIPLFCGKGFYGHHVHEAVKRRGCLISGCTVHFANSQYDEGPIVVQRCVCLEREDTVEIIAAKVFAEECEAFPEAINLVAEKGVEYFWRNIEQ